MAPMLLSLRSIPLAPLLLLCLPALIWCINPQYRIQAISVFRHDESEFHKYSAVLAATEPFRLQLEQDFRKAIGPINFLFQKLRGIKLDDPTSNVRIENKEVDDACRKYEKKVDDIVRSYGMTVTSFNELSKRLLKEPLLKHRVMLQAYYYRLAADVETNLRAPVPVLPSQSPPNRPKKVGGSQPRTRPLVSDEESGNRLLLPDSDDSVFVSFCKVLRNIETVRLRIKMALQDDLGVSKLPENFADADVYPTMCAKIQHACDEFPRVAEAFMRAHGITEEEFNILRDKMEKNAFFCIRVKNEIRQLDKVESSRPGGGQTILE